MPRRIRLGHALARYADATTRLKNTITKAYHLEQHKDGLIGFTKIYRRTVEGTEIQPNQGKLLQTRVHKVAKGFLADMGTLIDAAATKDFGNVQAHADLVVGGETFLANVPPPFLLTLQKQFTDLRTFIAKMPVLPPDEKWHWEDNQECYVSEVTVSTSSKLVKEGLVLYPHQETAKGNIPAQTQLVENTHIIGEWDTTKFFGGVRSKDRDELLERANAVLDGIAAALHECNATTVDETSPSLKLLGYVSRDII